MKPVFRLPSLLVPCLLFTLAGCSNDFNPKSPDFKERIVAFAILNGNARTQMVRLVRSYDSPTSNPKDFTGSKKIDSAVVTLNVGPYTYPCKDTLITDSGGAQTKVWIASGLAMTEGDQIGLIVDSPGFDRITARMKYPSRLYLYGTVLGGSGQVQSVEIGSSEGAFTPCKGYLFRLVLRGKKMEGGKQVQRDIEVPLEVRNENGTEVNIYPQVRRSNQVVFPVSNLFAVKDYLYDTWKAAQVEAYVAGYGLDENFYNYYFTVRGFDDPLTVRQDLPDFTNVSGGLGVLGAVSVDTVGVTLRGVIGP